MARRGNNNRKSNSSNTATRKISGFAFDGVGLADLIGIASVAGPELALGFIHYLCAGFILIVIMMQLRLSVKDESSAWVDALPSYKKYKSAITGVIGRNVAFAWGFYKTLPYIRDIESVSVSDLLIACTEVPVPNSKKILTCNAGNWTQFLSGQMSSMIGRLLSCPSTNFKMFNVSAEWVKSATLDSCIDLFKTSLGNSSVSEYLDQFSPDTVKDLISNALLTDSGGIPRTSLVFDEVNNLTSNIENTIFGETIRRTGTVNVTLSSGGQIPESSITENMLIRHLSPAEMIQYKAAKRQGVTATLQTLNNRVAQRMRRAGAGVTATLAVQSRTEGDAQIASPSVSPDTSSIQATESTPVPTEPTSSPPTSSSRSPASPSGSPPASAASGSGSSPSRTRTPRQSTPANAGASAAPASPPQVSPKASRKQDSPSARTNQ